MANQYLKNVAKLTLTAEKCTGCGMCEAVCPHGVFAVTDGKAQIVERDSCMECNACAENCPAQAIEAGPSIFRRRDQA
ncbi:hypothetical protein AGMMS49957_02700 [Synergistales bacterium]|nr:hypothetical protein AGMMS49957_02700 [Synergistales bacterium]